jgi:TRAP-type C4-dicarboxylate transport system substrate-binding protein
MFFPYRAENPHHKMYVDAMVGKVKESSNGELIVNFMGGPEVIPPFDQVEALRRGVLDITFIGVSFLKDLVPATDAITASEFSPSQERANGLNDYLNKLLKEQGLFYLGRIPDGGFYFLSRPFISEPYTGFRGLKFGLGGTMWISFAKKLGIITNVIPIAETYTGLERGVFDGCGSNALGASPLGFGEVCKYRIDHKFWPSGNSVNLMSLKSWNSLPKRLQDILMGEQIKMENAMGPLIVKLEEYEVGQLQKQGCKMLKFSPTDAEWYVKTAFEAKWEDIKQTAPEQYEKLREMLRK